MTPPKKLTVGVTTRDLSVYQGRHRDLEMDKGWGAFPMGDRNRVVNEFVTVEERDSDPNIRRI